MIRKNTELHLLEIIILNLIKMHGKHSINFFTNVIIISKNDV